MLMALTILGAMTAIPVRDGHRVVRGISVVSFAGATCCAESREEVMRSAAARRAGRIATRMRERFGMAEDDGGAVRFTLGKNCREA